MKSILLSVLLLIVLSVGLGAKSYRFVACTLDHFESTLAVEFTESATDTQVNRIGVAYGSTANSLNASDLIAQVGYQSFVSKLSEADKYAFSLSGPPVIGGKCSE